MWYVHNAFIGIFFMKLVKRVTLKLSSQNGEGGIQRYNNLSAKDTLDLAVLSFNEKLPFIWIFELLLWNRGVECVCESALYQRFHCIVIVIKLYKLTSLYCILFFQMAFMPLQENSFDCGMFVCMVSGMAS